MALIKCPECQNSISDKAEKCPHCGLPAEYFNVAGAPVEKVDGGIDYKSIANIIISFDKDCPICGFPLKYEFNKNYGLQLWICTNDSEVCDFMTNDKVHKHDIFKCPQCADGYMIVKMNPKNGKNRVETCDFSLFCRVHMKDTAPKEMGSNKQRKGRRRIRRRVHILRLKKDEFCGTI